MAHYKAKPGQPLTAREEEVLWLMAEGLLNKQIAERLGITDHTVKFHVMNCCLKMGTRSRTRASVQFIITRSMAELSRFTRPEPVQLFA